MQDVAPLSKYSPEFREEAVQLALKSNKPIAHTARELGVNSETLRSWVRRHESENSASSVGELGGVNSLKQRSR